MQSRTNATIAPPLPPIHLLPSNISGKRMAAVAAVELTVTTACPLVVPELSVTVWAALQAGGSDAPVGLEVTEHLKETVPL
jgi:hypothetical protein